MLVRPGRMIGQPAGEAEEAAPPPEAPVEGMTLWFRGDDVTFAEASPNDLESWNDLSGNGDHAVRPENADNPTDAALITLGTLGGEAALVNARDPAEPAFNRKVWVSSASVGDAIGADEWTVYCVFSVPAFEEGDADNEDGSAYSNVAAVSDPGGYWGLHARPTGPTLQAYVYDDGGAKVATKSFATGAVILAEMRSTSGTMSLLVAGGGAAATVAHNGIDSLTAGIQVGGNNGSVRPPITRAEIITYATHLSDEDRATNRAYLAGRYGVSW